MTLHRPPSKGGTDLERPQLHVPPSLTCPPDPTPFPCTPIPSTPESPTPLTPEILTPSYLTPVPSSTPVLCPDLPTTLSLSPVPLTPTPPLTPSGSPTPLTPELLTPSYLTPVPSSTPVLCPDLPTPLSLSPVPLTPTPPPTLSLTPVPSSTPVLCPDLPTPPPLTPLPLTPTPSDPSTSAPLTSITSTLPPTPFGPSIPPPLTPVPLTPTPSTPSDPLTPPPLTPVPLTPSSPTPFPHSFHVFPSTPHRPQASLPPPNTTTPTPDPEPLKTNTISITQNSPLHKPFVSSSGRAQGRHFASPSASSLAFRRSVCVMVLLLLLVVEGTLVQDSTIRLRQGNVKGVLRETNNRQIYAYLGIPYARPPIGSLRFQPPRRHEGWTTTLFASEFGAACPQPFLTGIQTSEDCLTINVWIPELPRGFRQYPVVVLMEGELFVTSVPSRFPGQDLAATDMIVVSFNYRTNAFGFLSWEDRILPGNLGLRDQSLALQWVGENIDKFGGDLTKVTLLGHSAGAASASYHLVHPRSQGPFQQMILMSGTHLAPWALSRNPRVASRRLSEHLGCGFVSGSTYLLGCLRNKDRDQIVKAVERLIEEGNPYFLFAPVVDTFLPHGERMVPLEPLSAVRESANRRIPLLLGLSENDGSVMLYIKREINYMTYDDLRRYSHEILVPLVTSLHGFTEGAEVVRRMVEYAYPDKARLDQTKNLVLEIVKLFTDGMFKAPMIKMAEETSRRGLNTHLFVNTFVSRDIYRSFTNISGALHGAELAYLFSPASYRKLFNLPLTYNEEQLSQRLKMMVYNFASSGLPYLAQYAPRWGRFTLDTPTYASLESGQTNEGYQQHQVAFWNVLLPELNALDASGGTIGPTYRPTTWNPTTEQQFIQPGDRASYQSAVWVLVAVVLILLGVIIIYIVCSRRRKMINSGTLRSQ